MKGQKGTKTVGDARKSFAGLTSGTEATIILDGWYPRAIVVPLGESRGFVGGERRRKNIAEAKRQFAAALKRCEGD